MANGKFSNGKRTNLKPVALLLAIALLVGTAVGGTLAWLTDKTDSVKNTFTVGNIDITLKEDTTDYKMIPGFTIDKDPEVAVVDGSEDCWLFVKVKKSIKADLDAYIAYAFADGWQTVVAENDNGEIVIGRQVLKTDTTKTFSILGAGTYTDPMGTADNTKDDVTIKWNIDQVGVKPSVTKQMMDALLAGSKAERPTLTFTAYAVQYYKTNGIPFEAAEAWAIANSAANS